MNAPDVLHSVDFPYLSQQFIGKRIVLIDVLQIVLRICLVIDIIVHLYLEIASFKLSVGDVISPHTVEYSCHAHKEDTA